MSGNPEAILYDINGNALAVQSGSATPASTPALMIAGSDGANSRYILIDGSGRTVVVGATVAGSVPVGNPLYLGIVSPSGNLISLIGDINGAVGTAIMANEFSILTNTTVTTNGSQIISKNNFGVQEINLIVNVTDSISGTTPTLQFTIQEIDPGNNTTTFGNISTTTVINVTGVYTATLNSCVSSAVKVSWVVGGTSPSFGGVYATVVSKVTPITQLVSGIVAVTQSTSPWVDNITQFGGTNISTGTGVGGVGIPRITVSNDSNILATQSGTWTVQPGNIANTTPWLVTGTKSNNVGTPDANNFGTLSSIANASLPTYVEGNQVAVSSDLTGTLRTNAGIASTSNSSTAPLGSNAVFTGIFESVLNSSFVQFEIFSDQASAVGGLQVQWSPNGTNADVSDSSSVSANTGRAFALTVRGKFFRIVYTNGVIAQGTFRLQTSYHAAGTGLISKLLSSTLDDNNYVQNVRSVLAGKNSAGNYVNLVADSDNTTNGIVKLPVLPARANTVLPSWIDGYQVPLSTLLTGQLRIDNTSWLGSTAPTVGQKTMTNSIPVVIASNQTAFPVQNQGSPISLQTNVTITGNGSLIVGVDMHDVPLHIVFEIKGPVTGTNPKITFTATDLDPQTLDATTIITTGPTLIGITTANFFTHITRTGKVQLSWVVTGTSPSFGGLYTTAVPRNEGGIGLAGTSIPNDTHSVGGKDPSGNIQPITLASEQSQYVTVNQNIQIIHSNNTVTSSGSTILTGYGAKEVSLFINVKNAPTGTSPTLTYTIQEVDPGDLTTVIGTSTTGASTTAAGTQIITLSVTKSGVIKVSWIVTGTTPSFTGVYATLVSKLPGVMIGVDSTGTQHPLNTDSSGNLQTVSPAASAQLQDIAIGKILAGGAAANNKFEVARTTYTEQSSNAQRSVSSSSASDTSAGTGARTIQITYYPFDLSTRKTETITLNGTTAVNTVNTDICYIEKIIILTVGSGGTNAGIISLFVGTGGTGGTIGSIALANPGSVNQDGIDGRTFWAHHYVISGKICTITTFDGGTQGNQNAEMFLSSKDLSISNAIDRQVSDSITVGLSAPTTPRAVPNTIIITGPARITLYVIPVGNNTAFFGSFDFYEK